MALVTNAQFHDYLTPQNEVAPPAGAATPINLTLSDGTTILVFDRLDTAMSLMGAMRQRGQWILQLNDDVSVVSISATKLLLYENTLTNQKFITSYLPVYVQCDTRMFHRNLSQTATLWDALAQSGLCWRGVTTIATNADLLQASMLLVDWRYPNTVLDDAVPLRYLLP
jgi:hypothetical protein